MEGRRSADYHFVLGYPQDLPQFQLPTKLQVINFAHFLKKDNVATGVWNHLVSNEVVASAVSERVSDIWNKTKIPTQCSYMQHFVVQKVRKLLDDCKSLLKLPKDRRDKKRWWNIT